MIPPDVASGLRLLQTDPQLTASNRQTQPASPAQRVIDVLGDLVPGQRIMAEIQALLPSGSYRAVVAQRDITLALPFSAKAGDSVELEVVESDGKLTLAAVANRSSGATAAADLSANTTLSRTGQMIGNLLADIDRDGGNAPPAPLNRNQPLVETMPAQAKDLAPVLKSALTQSGMFYEAHQARWVNGSFPGPQLLQEPQGQFSAPGARTLLASTNQFVTGQPEGAREDLPTNASMLSGSRDISPNTSSQAPLTSPVPFAENKTPVTIQVAGNVPAANLLPEEPPILSPEKPAQAFGAAQSTPTSPAPLSAQNIPDGKPLNPQAAAYLVISAGLEPTIADQVQEAILGKRNTEASAESVNTHQARVVAESELPPPGKPLQDTPQHTTVAAPNASTGGTAALQSQTSPLPAELTPLVQQQLHALATQTFTWQGQIWPGQQMSWEIEENGSGNRQSDGEDPRQWKTRLKLNLPQLGALEASLSLKSGNQIEISLHAGASQSDLLTRAAPELVEQLTQAGLRIGQLSINHGKDPA